mmetsp:Transcript_27372/g.40481  ORF Transcript_27372/g.40481 Transcript_27372/m.40481 type:complete len:202 (+) Transcript_27372:127-732(+)
MKSSDVRRSCSGNGHIDVIKEPVIIPTDDEHIEIVNGGSLANLGNKKEEKSVLGACRQVFGSNFTSSHTLIPIVYQGQDSEEDNRNVPDTTLVESLLPASFQNSLVLQENPKTNEKMSKPEHGQRTNKNSCDVNSHAIISTMTPKEKRSLILPQRIGSFQCMSVEIQPISSGEERKRPNLPLETVKPPNTRPKRNMNYYYT